MSFCGNAGGGERLEQAFASLSVQPNALPVKDATASKSTTDAITPAQKTELERILMSMRKLRESITASSRTDHFAQRAYVFIIHASILTRHWASYRPALEYLLHKIHPQTPLPEAEYREMGGYVVLDIACRQRELSAAYSARRQFKIREWRLDRVLSALVREDWASFWRTRRQVDGLQRALIASSDDMMRMHALKCIGRSYMTADKAYIERAADKTWDALVRDGIGWQLDENNGIVTIRKAKGT